MATSDGEYCMGIRRTMGRRFRVGAAFLMVAVITLAAAAGRLEPA
ncbi:MAG: hypothetical protein ACSLFO_13585 [Acidimicrobiales bacterium]